MIVPISERYSSPTIWNSLQAAIIKIQQFLKKKMPNRNLLTLKKLKNSNKQIPIIIHYYYYFINTIHAKILLAHN